MARSRSRSPARRRRVQSSSRSRPGRGDRDRGGRPSSATPSPPPSSKMRSDHVATVRQTSRKSSPPGSRWRKASRSPGGGPATAAAARRQKRSAASSSSFLLSQELSELQKRVKKDLFSSEASHDRKFLALGSLTRCEAGYIFQGAEFDTVSAKELRKIQIDIRRNIPAHRVSDSPIRRRIVEPTEVRLPRKKTEGVKPLFDREDILLWLPDITEDKTIKLLNEDRDQDRRERDKRSRRSPSNENRFGRMRSDRSRSPMSRGGVKSRLGEVNPRDRRDTRDGDGGERRLRDRLGDKDQKVLDREDLESQRPAVKPWDLNPEYVPRGRYYFEHDSREDDFNNGRRGGGFRGRGSWRGGGSWRGSRGGRGGYRGGNDFRRQARSPSPEWKHDLFEKDGEDMAT